MLCNLKIKQECIPEGCLPPAAVAVTGRGGVGLDQIPLNFHLGCGSGNLQGMLGPDPPGLGTPPGPGTPQGQAPPRTRHTPRTKHTPQDQTHMPPVNRITDTCKNITLPQKFVCGRQLRFIFNVFGFELTGCSIESTSPIGPGIRTM